VANSMDLPDSKHAAHSTVGEIPAEIVAAITAAATVFLGTRFRIRSLEMLHLNDKTVSRWTRVGRTSIQASHNTRSKR
jgi:hypothetical protein